MVDLLWQHQVARARVGINRIECFLFGALARVRKISIRGCYEPTVVGVGDNEVEPPASSVQSSQTRRP